MNELVGIVDYGVGNLHSISNAVTSFGVDFKIIDKHEDFTKFSKIILPGVGAYPYAMKQILTNGFDSEIYNFVKSGKYILGICLGMQILANKSNEISETKGLGLFDASVKSLKDFESNVTKIVLPNMGWREVNLDLKSKLFQTFTINRKILYFAHSYAIKVDDNFTNFNTSSFDFFGTSVLSSFEMENIHGLQFHPEKSGKVGIEILQNFINLK